MQRRILFFVLFVLIFALPSRVLAQWVDGNYAKNTMYQGGMPHFKTDGSITTVYSQDSFYPLGLYWVDMGPVPDANGVAQGQGWLAYVPNMPPSNTSLFRNTLPEVKAAGYNFIFPMGANLLNSYEIEALRQAGLKTVINVFSPSFYVANNHQFWTANLFKQEVARIRDSGVMLWWHLFDENPNPQYIVDAGFPMDLTKWTTIHDLIKQVDNTHPVYANIAGTTCWTGTFSDFSMFDEYLTLWVKNQETSQVERQQEFSRAMTQKNMSSGCTKPIIGIFQAFGAVNPVEGFALPTAQEIQAQYFLNFVDQASGLMWFVQQNGSWAKLRPWSEVDPNLAQGMNSVVNASLWNTTAAMNRFAENNKKVILAPAASDAYNVYFNSSEGLARSINVVLKNPGEANIRYLITANREFRRSVIRVDFPGKTISKITKLFANQASTINASYVDIDQGTVGGDIIKIEFVPFETSQTANIYNLRSVLAGFLKIFDYNTIVAKFGM